MSRLEYMSYSRASTWQRCQRLFQLKYFEGREEVSGELAGVGNDWHVVLANRLSTKSDALPENAWAHCTKNYAKEIVNLLYEAYCAHWAHDSLWNVVMVEKELDFEFGSVPWKCIFDAMVETEEGNLYILEHKLTKSVDLLDFLDKRAIDMQRDMYLYAARALGYNVQGIIYDVARRPMNRIRALETVQQMLERIRTAHINAGYFLRKTIPYDQERIDRTLADANAIITELWEPKSHYPRNGSACHMFGGEPCSFLNECESD